MPPAAAGPPVGNACPSTAAATGPAVPCVFVCYAGDTLHVSVQTTASGDQYPAISASCGGAYVRCQSSQSCSASSSSTSSSTTVGTCIVETGNALGWCSAGGASGVGLPPAVNDALGLAGAVVAAGQLLATTTVRQASDTAALGPDAATSCAAYYLNSCQFPCLAGDYVVVRVQAFRSGGGTYWGSGTCGGASASCSDWWPCTATSSTQASGPSVGTCTTDMVSVAICYSRRAQPPQETAIQTAMGAAGLAVGTALWGAGVALGTADSVSDHDRDSHRAPEEATSNSDPLSAASRPTSDDDGDGIQNRDERSRAHAASGLIANALVRTTSSDRVTFHFGHPGARATVRSPEGNVMTITYVSTQAAAGCPPAVAIGVPDLSPCLAPPAVATFSLAGDFVGARRASEPGTAVPASAFVVLCSPRASGRCLDGVGIDGTWTFFPATQAARATLQPKAPAGFAAVLGGKTFVDVAADSGDILGTGSGQNSRDALMPLRLWNWHLQGAGTTYQACSGGLVAPCLADSPQQERMLESRQYI